MLCTVCVWVCMCQLVVQLCGAGGGMTSLGSHGNSQGQQQRALIDAAHRATHCSLPPSSKLPNLTRPRPRSTPPQTTLSVTLSLLLQPTPDIALSYSSNCGYSCYCWCSPAAEFHRLGKESRLRKQKKKRKEKSWVGCVSADQGGL